MRDVYMVSKSRDLPLHRAPTATSSVPKVILRLGPIPSQLFGDDWKFTDVL